MYRNTIMFELTESIHIEASPDKVWSLLSNVERWWPQSNPEHIRIEVRSPDKSIAQGTQIMFEERVAGIKARAEGVVTRLVQEREATWEGTAQYRYLWIDFKIREGVSWQIAADGEACILSARVWAIFPLSLLGRVLEWYARNFLDIVSQDRSHARRELEYLKGAIEGAG